MWDAVSSSSTGTNALFYSTPDRRSPVAKQTHFGLRGVGLRKVWGWDRPSVVTDQCGGGLARSLIQLGARSLADCARAAV